MSQDTYKFTVVVRFPWRALLGSVERAARHAKAGRLRGRRLAWWDRAITARAERIAAAGATVLGPLP